MTNLDDDYANGAELENIEPAPATLAETRIQMLVAFAFAAGIIWFVIIVGEYIAGKMQ